VISGGAKPADARRRHRLWQAAPVDRRSRRHLVWSRMAKPLVAVSAEAASGPVNG
jgi:hypothetical protein